MSEKVKRAVLQGWFTMPDEERGPGKSEHQPHLVGARCSDCGTYYFPNLATLCRNPACQSERLEQIPLSRTGKLWSFTNAAYEPPEPYVASTPFAPFGIVAVELAIERMVVLGHLAQGVLLSSLSVGMPMELTIETLSADATTDTVVWKWRPLGVGGAS